jgi:hypothetical protein
MEGVSDLLFIGLSNVSTAHGLFVIVDRMKERFRRQSNLKLLTTTEKYLAIVWRGPTNRSNYINSIWIENNPCDFYQLHGFTSLRAYHPYETMTQ